MASGGRAQARLPSRRPRRLGGGPRRPNGGPWAGSWGRGRHRGRGLFGLLSGRLSLGSGLLDVVFGVLGDPSRPHGVGLRVAALLRFGAARAGFDGLLWLVGHHCAMGWRTEVSFLPPYCVFVTVTRVVVLALAKTAAPCRPNPGSSTVKVPFAAAVAMPRIG